MSVFGWFQSIAARTVRSCFEVVAKAIKSVPSIRGSIQKSCIRAFGGLLLSGHMAACVIRSSEDTMLSNSVCDSCHLLLFWGHKSLKRPFVVTHTKQDFVWLG